MVIFVLQKIIRGIEEKGRGKMQKLKNIEFLRTFLIFTIVMLHVCTSSAWSFGHLFRNIPLYQTLHDCFAKANNGVEGFFIIAGFLLVVTFKNSTTVLNFVKKKYIRLSPAIAFATLLCVGGLALHTMHFKLIPNILTIFLLNHFGICWAIGSNPILWFTSALFSSLLLYFCVLKFISEKYKKLAIIILIIMGYGILEYFQHGRFADPYHNYWHIFNVGFLRAMGGIGLGCIIGKLYKENIEKIKNFTPLLWQKVSLSVIEIVFLTFVVWWTACPHIKINNIVFVAGFTVLFSLFVFKKGYLSELLDKDVWVFLGKYQYSIYVIHYVIGKIYGFGVWKHYPDFVNSFPAVPVLISLISIIIFGIFTYHFVEVPCADYLTNKFLPKKIKS